ncbi:hypothetical protein B9Q04_20050 [Candidatus Marsarchaeota G2 archaeon BE_D]|uniref:Uncharacterized protein n=1 Tax=Candidatus Marsarchaeota G2 archaeon BE_D TaxID=1978158 RepID=A0A2R6BYE7_9ARCH|nr:MAG: hypothetical protein B9Q04_20050 [Candidatus Marsarchaeota G2 archaeon BE_D]
MLELLHRRGIHAKPWEVERALSHLTLAGFLESRRMPSRAQSGYRVRGATRPPPPAQCMNWRLTQSATQIQNPLGTRYPNAQDLLENSLHMGSRGGATSATATCASHSQTKIEQRLAEAGQRIHGYVSELEGQPSTKA